MSAPLLLHVFPTFAVGGAQVRFCAIAARFGAAARHAVVAMDGNTACAERLAPGLAVAYPAVTLPRGDTFAAVRRARAALAELRPDVLVTYNWGAIEWAMAHALAAPWSGRRHVHIEDGFGPEERDRQIPRRVWTRRICLRRSAVVLPSRTLLRIAADIWRLPPARLRYLPNGIDLDRFAGRIAADGTPGSVPPGSVPVIGTVAALRPEKNLARLLRAFALARRDHPARLVVVGDGAERPALEALARELGIEGDVRFAGHLPAPAEAYRGFDIFALSSDTEQMPLSLLEAMAAGLPAACTDVGDVAAMLAEPNRALVTARDDAALAAALATLLADPALRARLGAANRARAEAEYDQETMFRAYAGLFGVSLPNAPPRSPAPPNPAPPRAALSGMPSRAA